MLDRGSYWDIYRSPGVGRERRDRHTGHRRVITKGSSSLQAVRYLSTSLVTRPLFRLTQKKLRPIYDPVPQPARISHIYIYICTSRFVRDEYPKSLSNILTVLDDRTYVQTVRIVVSIGYKAIVGESEMNREREREILMPIAIG